MNNGDQTTMTTNLQLMPLLDDCFTEAQRAAERLMNRGEPQEWAYRTAYTAHIGRLEALISTLTRCDGEKTEVAYRELSEMLTDMRKFG